ncbi:MAG TPA: anti-sigma factor [Thermoleophilaceae bacterium]|nr:anti-sigma factor [Thermoleophilaceae bacterium]
MRSDHARFAEDVGAYLLDALDGRERRAFERHLRSCDECRREVERLRPAADVLPGSVEQIEPPARLKAAVMAEIEPSRPRKRRPLLRPVLVAAAVGLLIGIGVSQLGGDDPRTIAATVDEAVPRAGGSLRISDGSARLRLHDMPNLGTRRVYQVWLQHGDKMVPARTFEVGETGRGEVDLRDIADADGVYVTREARGGAQVPSEDPIVSVPL